MPMLKTRVSRSLRGRCIAGLASDPVANAPDRLQRRTLEGSIDLVSEVADVDVDDVRIAVEGEVPDMLQQSRARKRLAWIAHEVVQEREFLWRQVDRRLATT